MIGGHNRFIAIEEVDTHLHCMPEQEEKKHYLKTQSFQTLIVTEKLSVQNASLKKLK